MPELIFDLSRKINNINLGGGVKNCYIGSNLVKEIYLGDKLVKINDHVKFKIQQPEYNSYISQTPISSEETYINVDVRKDYSKAYSYIYFLNENDNYYLETNSNSYNLIVSESTYTAKYNGAPGLILYTTGYLSTTNQSKFSAYLDIYSKLYSSVKLHRYIFRYNRLTESGSSTVTNYINFNLWNVSIAVPGCLYSFDFIFANSANTEYFSLFSGGGSNTTFEDSADTYKRYRNTTIRNTGVKNLAYILCKSNNIDFYYNSTASLSDFSSIYSETENLYAENKIRNHYLLEKLNFSKIVEINPGTWKHVIDPNLRYMYNASDMENFFVVDKERF